ncbi:MAG: hypothetical protein ABSE04_03040 [Candidatus Microgenomates bacterium]|jgi:hypothetical protein
MSVGEWIKSKLGKGEGDKDPRLSGEGLQPTRVPSIDELKNSRKWGQETSEQGGSTNPPGSQSNPGEKIG